MKIQDYFNRFSQAQMLLKSLLKYLCNLFLCYCNLKKIFGCLLSKKSLTSHSISVFSIMPGTRISSININLMHDRVGILGAQIPILEQLRGSRI